MRLYEILVKIFQEREEWKIEAKKLAQKIPMNEKYVSDIVPKVKTAIRRINEETDLKINLEINRPDRGQASFTFQKLSDKKDD